jgi:hypothetical protein
LWAFRDRGDLTGDWQPKRVQLATSAACSWGFGTSKFRRTTSTWTLPHGLGQDCYEHLEDDYLALRSWASSGDAQPLDDTQEFAATFYATTVLPDTLIEERSPVEIHIDSDNDLMQVDPLVKNDPWSSAVMPDLLDVKPMDTTLGYPGFGAGPPPNAQRPRGSSAVKPDLLGVKSTDVPIPTDVRPPDAAGSPLKKQNLGTPVHPNWSPHSLARAFAPPAPAASSSGPKPSDLQQLMSFMTEFRDETRNGFVNMEKSHSNEMFALKTHFEDSLTLCRDEYRGHADQSEKRCSALEVEFRKLQTMVSTEHSEIKKQVASNEKATAALDTGRSFQTPSSSKFVARKIFARGWCNYGCESTEGMKTADLLVAGESLYQMLPSEMQSWMEPQGKRYHAPHYRNRQLQINLNDTGPDDAGWQICRIINDRLKNEGTTLNNKSFYLTPDMELWKRQRNGCLNRANDAILRELAPLASSELIKDWAGGKLYFSRGGVDCLLGSWNSKNGWTWTSTSILELWPQADLQHLATVMEWNR